MQRFFNGLVGCVKNNEPITGHYKLENIKSGFENHT